MNLSVALVEEGLASVHPTADRSEHHRSLKNAEDHAREKRMNLWKDFVPEEKDEEKQKQIEEDKQVERKISYEKVLAILFPFPA